MSENKQLGFFAENVATRYLEKQGYEIIMQNYTKPWGEIDIIARQGGVIVFAEVKANSRHFGIHFDPSVRVSNRKLSTIIKVAELYLSNEMSNSQQPWRVDILSVVLDKPKRKCLIKHFKNVAQAFV